METKGLLTFALGGLVLTVLWAIMTFTTIEGTGSLIAIVILGFLGFLLVGMGLSAIIEDANRKAKEKP